MAVPLLDKGVVVVAVDYDIAPKGAVLCFCPRWFFHKGYFIKANQAFQLSVCVPFTSFTGNMDLMVSQVRKSVVSVVQQYSHIRYLSLSLSTCYCFLSVP